MSNLSGKSNSSEKAIQITQLFNKMVYTESEEDLSSVMKWLESRNYTFASSAKGKQVELQASNLLTFKFCGIEVKFQALQSRAELLTLFPELGKGQGDTKEDLKNHDGVDKVQTLATLLKAKSKELVQLEAYAGQVPTWIVREQDEPEWLGGLQGPSVNKLYQQIMKSKTHQILIRVRKETSCLRKILPAISAAMKTGRSFSVFIELKHREGISNILPIVYLLDTINQNIVPGQFTEVAYLEQSSIDLDSEGILVVGDLLLPYMTPTIAALTTSHNKSITYVVDSISDLVSAVPAIGRRVWMNGVKGNNMYRSLLFVHQSIKSALLENFKLWLEKLKIKQCSTDVPSLCDFVVRDDVSEKVMHSVLTLGAKVLSSEMAFKSPTIIFDLGTSTDLVARKESGLGHILIVIPYRSPTELFALSNNLSESDEIFLYSTNVTVTTTLIKGITAPVICVNDVPVHHLGEDWLFVSNTGTSENYNEESVDVRKLKSIQLKESKEWSELSSKDKVKRLQNFAGEYSSSLPSILSSYRETFANGSICVQDAPSSGVSGMLLANANDTPLYIIITALMALSLRGQPIVLATLKSELVLSAVNHIKKSLPVGLVTIVAIHTVKEMLSFTQRWNIIWLIQGSERKVQVTIPFREATKVLLVNGCDDDAESVEVNAELALSTALKACQM